MAEAGKHEEDLRSITRIVLRPIGSPLPLGFFTVAIDSVLVSCLQWGIIPASHDRSVAMVVFPAFIMQVIAGIFALVARDSIAATLMLSFATTWLVDTLIFWANPPGGHETIGIFFIVFSAFLALIFISALEKRALALVVGTAVPRFLVSGLAEVTASKPLAQAAAVLGLLLTAVALYTAFAFLWEDSRSQQLLPVGRLGPARAAVKGGLATELWGIERQPGVRRTL
ncbi:MAG TPA: acetate uptake transporter [Trebonia sp.]|nr:acetate uptake transporter [Trebonia sp.]